MNLQKMLNEQNEQSETTPSGNAQPEPEQDIVDALNQENLQLIEQNKTLQSTIQTLELNNSKLTKQNEELLTLSENERQLIEQNKQLKSNVERLNERLSSTSESVEFWQNKADYYKQHVEVKEVEKEVHITDKKCEKCVKEQYQDKLRSIKDTKFQLEHKYQDKLNALGTMPYMLAIYSIVSTLLYGYTNQTFKRDFMSAYNAISAALMRIWNIISTIAKKAATGVSGNMKMLYLIFYILVIAICIAIIAIPICAGTFKMMSKLKKEDYLDEVALCCLFASVAVVVNLALYIKPIIHINLILFIILLQVVVLAARAAKRKHDEL